MSGPYRVDSEEVLLIANGNYEFKMAVAAALNAAYAAGPAGGVLAAELEKILDAPLPCDVGLEPATIMRKGVKFRTLLVGLEKRGLPSIRSLLPPQTSTRDGGKESV